MMKNRRNVTVNCDVVVCGAGPAGFCAAIAAARSGVKTVLIEKYPVSGGTMTVLGSNSVDRFCNPFRKENKQIISGIGWELICRINKAGFAYIPDMNAPYENHWQYSVKINPVAAAAEMDIMLCNGGVSLFYGQPVADLSLFKNKIDSVFICTKNGLQRVKGRVYIDCTGDGDVCAIAGAEYEEGDDSGTLQPGTIRYYPVGMNISDDDYVLNFGDNCNHVPFYSCRSDSLTKSEIHARALLYNQMKTDLQQRIIACAPGVAPREGRRIIGRSYMESDDYINAKIYEDSICYTHWFIDIHKDNEPSHIVYLKSPETPAIRFSSMLPENLDNVITAGRCISSDRDVNSAIRVKASCMAMGQVAGVAAALSCKYADGMPCQLNIMDIKKTLLEQGAVVPGYENYSSFSFVN